jgi:hypothetical protein
MSFFGAAAAGIAVAAHRRHSAQLSFERERLIGAADMKSPAAAEVLARGWWWTSAIQSGARPRVRLGGGLAKR